MDLVLSKKIVSIQYHNTLKKLTNDDKIRSNNLDLRFHSWTKRPLHGSWTIIPQIDMGPSFYLDFTSIWNFRIMISSINAHFITWFFTNTNIMNFGLKLNCWPVVRLNSTRYASKPLVTISSSPWYAGTFYLDNFDAPCTSSGNIKIYCGICCWSSLLDINWVKKKDLINNARFLGWHLNWDYDPNL